jgi:MFS family permease
MADLISTFKLTSGSLGHLTSAVQFGFITGTLTLALLMISDRFSPSKVFCISAFFAAIFNASLILDFNTFWSLVALRFLAGFSLAGIYPVGMKIAADYFPKTLGLALGFLVGALVLGTSFPHLLKGASIGLSWTQAVLGTSTLSLLGGVLMIVLIKDGPYRKAGKKLDLKAFFKIFENKSFRSAAFGYFGHMWELYAFWAFVPVIVSFGLPKNEVYNVAMISFFIIAIGSIACVIGGYLSQKRGTAKIAFYSLSLSALCCLLSPIILINAPFTIRILFFLLWGMFVIADSPLFSTMVANNAEAEIKGTALTIVNCLGFAITILSIQILTYLNQTYDSPYVFLILVIGPIIGLWTIKKQAIIN